MTHGRRPAGAPSRLGFTAITLCLIGPAAVGAAGCRHADTALGPPDSYLVFEPGTAHAAGDDNGARMPSPLFAAVALDDPRALPIHRAASEGFVGELLRTDYLVKELLRVGWEGRAFSPSARAGALAPTVLVLAGNRMARTDEATLATGFETKGFFGRLDKYPNATWIDLGEDPLADPAFVQTAAGRIARLVAARLTSAVEGAPAPPAALIDGYALAMEVIGREWRVGEGPQGTLPPSAGTGTQREHFAGVRQNAYVLVPEDRQSLRPAAEMLNDPGVIATVLYRMAQSKGVGRRVAPPEIYAPFVKDRVPPGVSPAAVLGPVRNFQVKLLVAWARAMLAGRPPRDLVDLVNAYADAMPAERTETLRLFVVTTYGATVKAGGVSPRAAEAPAALGELTALAAEVAAGRRSLRAGLTL